MIWGVISLRHIYLIRHCKATGQEPNARLTIEGQEQADRLAEFMAERKIDYIVSSPYERAINSIRPLANILRLRINIDERLGERVLSMEQLDDWMERLKESFEDLDLKLPGGESSREAMRRGVAVVEEIISSQFQNSIIVTHGNLMTLILKHNDKSYGFDEWKSLTNPDIYEIDKDLNGRTHVKRLWK